MTMLSAVLLGFCLALLILLTISGNVLVCLAVCASRRLRCLTNCFIVSLAVTDLLLGTLVLPFSAMQLLKEEWPLGPAFCNIYISLDVMLCTASILTLLAISVDRYLAVTVPLRYTSLVLPWRVAVAMACVWTMSLAVSFLPIHLGWNTPNGNVQNRGPGAKENACVFQLNRPYALCDSILTFFLPLLAMCWTYHRVMRIARAQARRLLGSRPACSSSTAAATPATGYNSRMNPSSLTAVALREHKATLTLAAVIGAFVICWLPYFIMFMVMGVREEIYEGAGYHVVLWLGYVNSALNPVLYAALNRDFRSAYTRLLRCQWPGYNCRNGRQPSPAIAAGCEVTEVTLLCGHTPSACRADQAEQGVVLQNSTAMATIELRNGSAVTDVNDNERIHLIIPSLD